MLLKQLRILVQIKKDTNFITGNVCTGKSMDGTAPLLSFLFAASADIPFKYTFLASTTSSLIVMSESALNTCFAYTSACDGSTPCKQAEFLPHATSLRFFGRCKHAFTVAKRPVQICSSNSRGLQGINIKSIFRSTGFCTGLSSSFFPQPSVQPLKSHSTGGTSEVLFIAFVHHRLFVAISRRPQ